MIFEIQDYEALRQSVERLCDLLVAEQIATQKIFDSKLVLYELLGNVLKHSQGGAKWSGELVGEHIELRVIAANPYEPPERGSCSEVYAENGRGWFLIDNLCEERFYKNGEIFVKICVK